MRGRSEILGVPGRIDAIDADEHFTLAEAAGLHGIGNLLPRGFLGVRRNGVLKVEDHPIGCECLGFFECAGVRARHVEHAAARTNCHAAIIMTAARAGKPAYGLSRASCGLTMR